MTHRDEADAELMGRLARGDETALRDLYQSLGPSLVGLAQKVVGDRAQAEDVVQEVFVQLWDDPSRFDPTRGSVGGFLATWVKNRAKDSARRQGAYERAKERASDRVDGVLEPISRIDKTGLENALSDLPSEQRELLERMYYEGQTQTDIAEDTGIALGTVKSRIRLGMARLRESFARFSSRKQLPRLRGQGKREE